MVDISELVQNMYAGVYFDTENGTFVHKTTLGGKLPPTCLPVPDQFQFEGMIIKKHIEQGGLVEKFKNDSKVRQYIEMAAENPASLGMEGSSGIPDMYHSYLEFRKRALVAIACLWCINNNLPFDNNTAG